MVVYDDALTILGKLAADSSATALTFLKLCYNAGYKQLLVEFRRDQIEDTRVIDLEANQRSYQMPVNCVRPNSFELIDSTTITPLFEVASDQKWSYLKSNNQTGRPTHYHYRPRFGLHGGLVELYPIPSSSDYDLRMFYDSSDKDLSQAAYSTGTVTLTQGDETVTGSGTTFTAAMVDRYLIPTTAGTDAYPYRIASYTSATSIELENKYAGSTGAGASYRIVEIPNLPEDMHMLPIFWALDQWWNSAGNAKKALMYENKYKTGLAMAKRTHSSATGDGIVNQGGFGSPFAQYPYTFPMSIAE